MRVSEFFKKIVIPLLFLLGLPYLTGQERVNIYTGFSPERFGRAADRSRITRLWTADFRGRPGVEAPAPEGYLTGVLVDGRLFGQILAAVSYGEGVRDENTSFTLESRGGAQAFHLVHKPWDLDFVFALEQAPEEILQAVRNFYALDPFNRDQVLQEYREHRVVRIYRGSDVLERDGKLSFGEALVAATLLGKTFQPFYGFHDGAGFLDNLSYLLYTPPPSAGPPPILLPPVEGDSRGGAAPVNPQVRTVLPPREEPASQGVGLSEWEEFLHHVDNMTGSFPENLFVFAKTVIRLREASPGYLSPEDLLSQKAGGSREFALFFYRILKDRGYDVRLLRTSIRGEEAFDYMVLYKEHSQARWGLMTAEYWTGERFNNWTRIPALRYEESAEYQELDGRAIMESREWFFPRQWEESLF
jgi:hypothetical protein